MGHGLMMVARHGTGSAAHLTCDGCGMQFVPHGPCMPWGHCTACDYDVCCDCGPQQDSARNPHLTHVLLQCCANLQQCFESQGTSAAPEAGPIASLRRKSVPEQLQDATDSEDDGGERSMAESRTDEEQRTDEAVRAEFRELNGLRRGAAAQGVPARV